MLNILGIDLGTTRIVAAVLKKNDLVTIAPPAGATSRLSLVAFGPHGQSLLGRSAQEQACGAPENTVYAAKRLLGRRIDDPAVRKIGDTVSYEIVPGPEGEASIFIPATHTAYTPPEILARPLQELRRDAEAQLGETVDTALMTTPACFCDSQRLALAAAGQLAGFNVLGLMDDPLAAALAYTMTSRADQILLTFDLGGGTLSVAVLSLQSGRITVEAAKGDPVLGGDDWDNRLVSWFVRKFKHDTKIDLSRDPRAIQRLRHAAEKAKIELSTASETEVELPCITADRCGPKHFKLKLTRPQFELLTADLVARCGAVVESVLQEADLTAGALDHILLLGGSSGMPMIQERLVHLTGKVPDPHPRSGEAVALGAAIQAWQVGAHVARNLSEFIGSLLNKPAKPHPKNQESDRQTKPSGRPKTRGWDAAVQISLDEAFTGTTRFLQGADGSFIEAKIPPGVQDGWRLRLPGRNGSGGTAPTKQELCLMVEIKPNPRFERVGDNLRVTAPLELHTALLGGEVNVATVDRTVKLHIPAGTDHGTVFRLRGLGMPHLANSGQRGDLYVTVELQLPRDLSQDEKKLLQQWQAMRKQSPSESNHSRNESM